MSAYMSVVGVVFLFYMLQFGYGQYTQNNSIVDIFWGLGFVIAVWFALFYNHAFGLSSLLTTLLVTLWGIRLFYHIFKRNHGRPEDFRYVNFRKKWGHSWVKTKAFFQVYMLQMFMLLVIVSAPVNIILNNHTGWSLYTIIGLLVWCLGYYFEVKADQQLRRFKSDASNKGKILTTGLYKYSRHPNYFGEATMWWGIYIIGLDSGGLWYIISPLTITVLLRYFSGVPLLEKHYENNRAYQKYAEKTSIFIPWFPKK
ncbi:DUF1295 domain-containing protein [Fusibacter ferrireducens]|uniref:DUF1295 domain-containing protein n=1 Tax=Fusibacter ferrireducens TaxID=2785058 RepID=A0ABR9ZWL5_9FIRM|nr:DUF1295 domain-containing protein [Fusibacter ferrireducens]MBF4694838.1 DUF1295 domain-containing protein [Fusibacter ferrireducens]